MMELQYLVYSNVLVIPFYSFWFPVNNFLFLLVFDKNLAMYQDQSRTLRMLLSIWRERCGHAHVKEIRAIKSLSMYSPSEFWAI